MIFKKAYLFFKFVCWYSDQRISLNTFSLYFSDCPFIIITPSLQFPEYGETVHFSGVIQAKLELPTDARWQKVKNGNVVHNLDPDDEKYWGSHGLSPPLLVVHDVDFDDVGDYRLQVKISTGWCSSRPVEVPRVIGSKYITNSKWNVVLFPRISFFIMTKYSV